MYRQFNPHAQNSKSPYRNLVDNSESSSVGPQTQSSYNKYQGTNAAGLNFSPIKSNQPKFSNADKNQGMQQASSSYSQNVHKRLREY